jgi:DNA invertase Pin-like site-specific DNA recombinase
MGRKLIAYYRVSTAKQGASGLGLEAQTESVRAYASANDGDIIGAYQEVESGKRCDRPALAKALAHAKRAGATCVFAKLDRLARNARFLLGIVESGADVVFCDLPNIPPGPTGKFILTNMAGAAELEAGLASVRTRESLKAAKARGVLLGSSRPGAHRLTGGANADAARRAGEVSKANADAAYFDIADVVRQLRQTGASLADIAKRLTDDGLTTRTGKPWNKVQVGRVLKRVGALTA